MNKDLQNQTPEQVLKTLRFLWIAMLLGQLILLGVVIAMGWNGDGDFESVKVLYMAAVVMGLTAVPMASFIRMQIYKKNWVGNQVAPQGYFQGTLVSLAVIEAASFFAMVVVLIHGHVGPTISLPIALIAVFGMNYPNGKPMQPANPDFINNQPPDLLKK
jgi:hypothetical protein